jgi:AsmA protein
MLMRSKLVASNQGQGGVEDAKGLTIPVAISGPWTKVKVSPKISDGAKTKAKAILDEKKNELEQKIKDEGAKKLLKGLLNR